MRVSGENEFPVPAMQLPELPDAPDASDAPDATELATFAEVDAVALFLERARAADPDFILDASNAGTVAEICRHLDGLPLGIELAAARVFALSPATILARLEDQLGFLAGGNADRPPHQRTMRDTIAWSHALLSAPQRLLFRRLAFFAGGFRLDMAERIARLPVLDDTASRGFFEEVLALIDMSLIRKVADVGGESRLTMLATIRDFGLEQLDAAEERDLVASRHARALLDFAEGAAPGIVGSDPATWLERIDAERANLRLAFGTFEREGDWDSFARLAAALSPYWIIRAHHAEGGEWLGRVLAHIDSPAISDELRVDCLLGAGQLTLRHGDRGPSARYLAEALPLARALGGVRKVRALQFAANLARRSDDFQTVRRLLEESLAASREVGDLTGEADALRSLAYALMNLGEMDDALARNQESVAVYRRAGDARGTALALINLDIVYYVLGEYELARDCVREAYEVLRRVGDTRSIALALTHLGLCATHLGDLEEAARYHAAGLTPRLDVGDPRGFSVWLEAVALLLASANDAGGATIVLAAADAARDAAQTPLANSERGDHDRTLDLVHARHRADQFEADWRRGKALTIQAAIDFAMTRMPESVAAYVRALSDPALTAFGLTQREEQVLRLIARRLSDREIAAELFISPRTVARHVAGILQKLDVHSRRDASAIAIERGFR
jgi:predicted ATPase/DNA-binding CsgD family transcriptional regulator